MHAENLINAGKLEIKTPDVTIRTKQEKKDLIETRMIDGELYLLIPAGECMEIGGIQVATKKE